MATSSLENAFRDLFEALARANPQLTYEWRNKSTPTWGSRLDLVCAVGTPVEVFASVFESSVAVGDLAGHTDVEDFGRGFSDAQIAEEAVRVLADKLEQRDLIATRMTLDKSLDRTRVR
ncbi:hypothetical protein [Dokdonella sp.]|uniref:hypothetical protein n=1 Tax=Dokdonella sp. TaxID=2291710 RepID=UPI003784FA87